MGATEEQAGRESKDFPYPPFALANRVLKMQEDDGYGGFLHYEIHGAGTHDEICALLPDDFDFAGKRLLDFGCGAGRTLRHFIGEAEVAEVWGADLDERSVDWVEANLCPPLHVVRSGVDPPLPFESGSFDLIWAISIFTHLTTNSLPWLLELHRILKPGGLLMASYMGRWNSEAIAGEPWDPDRIGCNVLKHDAAWDRGGPMVLMSDWWVHEHWGRAFEFIGVNERVHNQTWPMLRRRDVELTLADLERPADDEREVLALRHNVLQVQREVEEQAARADELERAAAELRSSRAWRAYMAAYGLTPWGRRGGGRQSS